MFQIRIIAAILVAVTRTFQQECHSLQYDRQQYVCCDGGVLKPTPETGISAYFYDCCGSVVYSTDNQKCCKNVIFNTTTSFCYNETVFEKSDATSVFNCGEEQQDFWQFACCGGKAVEVNKFDTLCCNNKVLINPWGSSFLYPECCGDILIFRINQICCEGNNVYNFTGNEYAGCCGDKKFDGIKEKCINNSVILPI